MEQKDYNMEIVLALLKGKIHLREMAKRIGTNPMMVIRKMRLLAKGNIVDFAQEGKNKAYFLKTTAEAKAYVSMAEKYALLAALRKYPELRGITDKINADKRIELAILFGSYAKGIPKKDSDIDIYIETEDSNIKKELQFLDSKLSIKIGKYNKDNLLIREIDKNHVIIKGVEYYYEKSKFFG
ncbi:MAG: nucleotidyltransferase domain-containing protein [Nanoarchaeota archaeon]